MSFLEACPEAVIKTEVICQGGGKESRSPVPEPRGQYGCGQKGEVMAKSPAWQRKEGKSPKGGLNAKGRASYNKANPGKPGFIIVCQAWI